MMMMERERERVTKTRKRAEAENKAQEPRGGHSPRSLCNVTTDIP
jgi:hypothetical protein